MKENGRRESNHFSCLFTTHEKPTNCILQLRMHSCCTLHSFENMEHRNIHQFYCNELTKATEHENDNDNGKVRSRALTPTHISNSFAHQNQKHKSN